MLDLRVAVVSALSLEPETDPFVPIAGGPGQSTVEFYAGYATAFEEVRRKRDIVLMDQREAGELRGRSYLPYRPPPGCCRVTLCAGADRGQARGPVASSGPGQSSAPKCPEPPRGSAEP